MILLLLVCVFFLALFILLTRCRKGHQGLEALRGWAYAHRGLFGDGVPENSMEAFRLALEGGYGVELDVHLLKDGNLAVIHDSKLLRTTGLEGSVEDLKASDLARCYLEGTEQTVPEFGEVLRLFAGRVPLIIELKCERNNYHELCEAVCDVMNDYSGPYCLESFDPRCIYWLRKNRPEIVRGQLTENYFRATKAKLPGFLKFLLVNQLLNFLTLPDFVAYRFFDRKNISNLIVEKLWKAQSVTWTLKSKEEFNIALGEGRIPIFEGFCP